MISAVAIVASLPVIGALTPQPGAASQTAAPVIVTNTPLPVQGNVNVSAAVTAAQSGMWGVTVNNPAIHLSTFTVSV